MQSSVTPIIISSKKSALKTQIQVILSSLALIATLIYSTMNFLNQNHIVWILVTAISAIGLIVLLYLVLTEDLKSEKSKKEKLSIIAESLESQNEQLQTILQNIQEGVLTTDLSGKIRVANKRALDILGFGVNDIKDKYITEILLNENLLKKNISNLEVNSNLSNGKTIFVSINIIPLVTSSGVLGTIFILHDISTEKELEKMKLDFVSIATHHLRTPLTILKDYLGVFKKSVEGKLTPEEKIYLERSIIGADQLGFLIENLLNVSQIEKRQLKLHLQSHSLEKIINDAVSQLSEFAHQKNIQLVFEKPSSNLPMIPIDPSLISVVLNSLITNAIDNSFPGRNVIITVSQQANMISTHIKDFGKGIPLGASENLFTEFFKVTPNLVYNSKGIGLGLYVSKAIIDAHKGQIWVDSVEGRGATFNFSLPISV